MKKAILMTLMMLLAIAGLAQAAPWAVCDPQADADGYAYSLDGGAWLDVPYTEQTIAGTLVAVIVDLESVSVGQHNLQVKAFRNDTWGGRLESTSSFLDFERPAVFMIIRPSEIRIRR
jgi:hypothetical protein